MQAHRSLIKILENPAPVQLLLLQSSSLLGEDMGHHKMEIWNFGYNDSNHKVLQLLFVLNLTATQVILIDSWTLFELASQRVVQVGWKFKHRLGNLGKGS